MLKWPTFQWQCESLGVKVYKGCILLIHLFQFVLKDLNSGIQGCTSDVLFGYFLFYFILPFGQKSKRKVKVMSKGARDVLLHSCSLFIYFSSSFSLGFFFKAEVQHLMFTLVVVHVCALSSLLSSGWLSLSSFAAFLFFFDGRCF